ncbi:hypothetical protein GCM10022419_095020 [Nonomuraea rosea]|uniref:Uncharacterized protein n=1 Tax=Nonomuraea rosea TaxID=638574 RepID=A0ABP6Z3Q0_9ACTN
MIAIPYASRPAFPAAPAPGPQPSHLRLLEAREPSDLGFPEILPPREPLSPDRPRTFRPVGGEVLGEPESTTSEEPGREALLAPASKTLKDPSPQAQGAGRKARDTPRVARHPARRSLGPLPPGATVRSTGRPVTPALPWHRPTLKLDIP